MKFLHIVFLVISIFLLPVFSFSQKSEITDAEFNSRLKSENQKDLIELNSELILLAQYERAELVADKLLTYKPESPNYNYRKGFALVKVYGDYIRALPYFKVAAQNVSKNFKPYSVNENGAPVDAIYYLAVCYHRTEKIALAEQNFRLYQSQAPEEDLLSIEVEKQLQQCQVAKSLLSAPGSYNVENIGNAVNTDNPEYSSVISPDGENIYFTTIRRSKRATPPYMEDVYRATRKKNGDWNTPEMMSFCKPRVNEAAISISADERTVYIYKDETGNGDIYYSAFENNEFGELKLLPDNGVNTDAWEPHITTSIDGRTKYFTSNRPGGYGGRDIYMIELQNDGTWSEPTNLGPTINTAYEEDSPFIALDNRTLYFASNGPNSMGGFDVFKSVRQADGTWAEPVNMGSPLNSTGDDAFFSLASDGHLAYFTSWREDGYGDKDIYSLYLQEKGYENVALLKGDIKEAGRPKTDENIYLTLRCTDCGDDYTQIMLPKIDGGGFMNSLEPCHEYELGAFRKRAGQSDERLHLETFRTDCNTEYEEIVKYIRIGAPSASLKGDIVELGKETLDPNIYLTLKCVSCNDEMVDIMTPKQADGSFAHPLESCSTYELAAYRKIPREQPEELHKEEFSTDCNQNEEIIRHIVIGGPKDAVPDNALVRLKYYFNYNNNVLTLSNPELTKFLNAVQSQLNSGRESVTILINSSASHVPTATYKENILLSKKRAENIRDLLANYFRGKGLTNKVKLSIENTIVDGPVYVGDYKNLEKYFPYQFIELITVGEGATGKTVSLKSED